VDTSKRSRLETGERSGKRLQRGTRLSVPQSDFVNNYYGAIIARLPSQ
jgi:hypothetical protein